MIFTIEHFMLFVGLVDLPEDFSAMIKKTNNYVWY